MEITYDPAKDTANKAKHGFSLELSWNVFDDPLVAVVFDRIENGKERWHAIGIVGLTCLLVVHVYPDPDDESSIRAIGLRKATANER